MLGSLRLATGCKVRHNLLYLGASLNISSRTCWHIHPHNDRLLFIRTTIDFLVAHRDEMNSLNFASRVSMFRVQKKTSY